MRWRCQIAGTGRCDRRSRRREQVEVVEQVGAEHLMLQGNTSPNALAIAGIGDPIPLDKVEELHIRAILSTTPSIEKAAQTLGMDTVTLWRRRKKYGI